jgi:hypothetical protein
MILPRLSKRLKSDSLEYLRITVGEEGTEALNFGMDDPVIHAAGLASRPSQTRRPFPIYPSPYFNSAYNTMRGFGREGQGM